MKNEIITCFLFYSLAKYGRASVVSKREVPDRRMALEYKRQAPRSATSYQWDTGKPAPPLVAQYPHLWNRSDWVFKCRVSLPPKLKSSLSLEKFRRDTCVRCSAGESYTGYDSQMTATWNLWVSGPGIWLKLKATLKEKILRGLPGVNSSSSYFCRVTNVRADMW